jgi:energy-coupling factor transporter ATP-binding protein EcfA2
LDSARRDIHRLESEETLLVLVQTLLQSLIDKEVTYGVQAVERLQTDGLRTVFGDQDLSVKSSVDVQRGKVSVELVTVQKLLGQEVEGVSGDAFGGAVTTVQSVLLRITMILRRGLRPLMFLDETLPAFDHNYVVNMGAFLSALCSKLNMDILLVTHNPALVEAADHAYRLVRKNGSVKVEVTK